jgi:hypothetical protein
MTASIHDTSRAVDTMFRYGAGLFGLWVTGIGGEFGLKVR